MSGKRILVVDDSATQLQAVHALLESHGYSVHGRRTGEAALDAARTQPFDLVLSDVIMPGMSGYELCAAIKQQVHEPPPVVLLTSLNDPRDIVRGVECGADNYITKPYEPERLLERIAHVLANQRLRDEAPADGPLTISFLNETFTIRSQPAQILALLLSSFEELIRTNSALQESKRLLAEAHARELAREQEARARAEADTRRMEALKQKAEAAARARDDVLATVSHDLKNPVGTIYTSASLLLEMPLDADAQTRQIQIIRRTAERMNRLIQDLLDVARMEAGGFTIEVRPESVRAIAKEARELLSTLVQARKLALQLDLPDDDIIVAADRGRILQVLSNLIGNAVKFTPAGGTITVAAERTADHVTIAVTDSGVGIAPDDLGRIFDRFWHSGKGAGSGLGLAIAKGIVEAHRGTIAAESSGGGSTFRFTLPLASIEERVPG